MNELPKIVRARLKAEPSGDHPDPNLLAAFAEQALPDHERAPVLLHLARCADCRDVLALAVPSAESATDALDTTTHVRVFRWSILRWGALAACVVIVGSAVLMKRDSMVRTPASKIVAMPSEEQLAVQAQPSARVPLPAPAPLPPRYDESFATGAHEQVFVSNEADLDANKKKETAAAKTKALQAAPPKILMLTPGLSTSRTGSFGVGHGAGIGSGTVAGAAGSAAAAYASRSNPGAPAKPASPRAEEKALPVVAEKVADQKNPSEPLQTVEVQAQAQAPAIETEANTATAGKQETPGRAKSPVTAAAAPPTATGSLPSAKGAPLFDRMTPQSSETVTTNRAAMAKDAASANRERMVQAYVPVSRWTISSDGQLEHSIDSGKTWQPVAVADNATFRALSANGPDLWVGGASGLLYHSADAGGHWTRVKPAAGATNLTADIAAIEFTDARQGKITASNGEVWLTDDGGQNWHKQ
jgi:hypothetical protein